MPLFQFNAIDKTGKMVTGQRKALNAEDLAGQLQKESLTPLEITVATKKSESSKKTWSWSGFLQPKVSQDELQMFCRQMYTVLKAGIPIGLAVARLAETTRDKVLVKALHQIMIHLNQGKSLYASLSKHPEIFSDFFINLVKVGESTGELEVVFLHLAKYLELETDTKKKVKSAMRYPIMVLVATLVALIIINVFVIPAFADFFKSFGAKLPLMTRILIVTSDFIVNYWYVMIGVTTLAILAMRYYINTPTGRIQWASIQLKIPIVGWLIQRIILTRFARLYALVLRSGITAVDGIELVGESTGNAFLAKKIKIIANLVGRGNSISNSIAQTKLFPPLVLQMITLGEETGNVDKLLDDVAEFYEREIEYDLVRLSDAIEPIMLIIMGAMVTVLALGIFLPMWGLAGQITGRG